MDSLREKIAEQVRYFQNYSGLTPEQIADRILALPEMEALRLKPIKTMPVR